MRQYHQLNREERYQIEKQLQEGRKVNQVALSLGFDSSTIYREVSRNRLCHGEYSAKEAWRRTVSRRARQDFCPKFKIKDWVEERILDCLALGWSPEQISGRLRLEHGFSLSHEAIYKYILKDKKYGGTLYKCLRRRGRKRRLRRKSRFLPQWEPRKFIDERPLEADERSEFGHWERDTMVSAHHEGGLLVFTERKSRLILLNRVTTLDSQETLKKSAERFQKEDSLPISTVTNDNGPEMAKHKELENILGIAVYFARPYAPWQRGSNENSIGLVRQFIPKGTDIQVLTDERICEIEDAINNRPRKILGFRTPNELMDNKELSLCPMFRHWHYEHEAIMRITKEVASVV